MVSSAGHLPRDNHLLASLGHAEQERIFPQLQLVEMPLGKVLYESGDALRHVFFAADCIVSLLYVLENGQPGHQNVPLEPSSSPSAVNGGTLASLIPLLPPVTRAVFP
jgi:hypothetical protein